MVACAIQFDKNPPLTDSTPDRAGPNPAEDENNHISVYATKLIMARSMVFFSIAVRSDPDSGNLFVCWRQAKGAIAGASFVILSLSVPHRTASAIIMSDGGVRLPPRLFV